MPYTKKLSVTYLSLGAIWIKRSLFCAGVAEHGQRRRLQEPILQRFVGSNPTPCTSQEPPVFREFLLSTTTLTLQTVERRVKAINQLKSHVDLFDCNAVIKYLNCSSWSNGNKNIVLQSYNDFQRMYGLAPVPLKKFHVTSKIVFIPLELEVDQLIAGCNRKLSCYLSLLKECGVRPIEAWSLLFTDIDTKQKTINISTKKHGVPRILPISDNLIDLLFGLTEDSKYIFAVSNDVLRFPKELTHFTRNYLDKRREIALNLNNPRIKQISLYTFRHWRATMLYLATRDIYHCKWFLGHSRIENTMKYVDIANAIHRDTGNYSCKIAKTLEEATALIEAGFEYVTEMDSVKLFKKRK